MLYNKKVAFNHHDSLTILYNFIQPESSVLDIGCACGDLASVLVKNKNCQVCGIEYNPQSVEQCQKLRIFEELYQKDLNFLTTTDYPLWHKKFDYVVCGDVLEHLLYPDTVLQILLSYLKDNGELLISLPNIAHASIKATLLQNNFNYTDLGILDKTHLHFYTYKTIASFLADKHLQIEEMNPVFLPLEGYQSDSFSSLPQSIQEYIKNDKHSFVMQYVMRCKINPRVSVKENVDVLNAFDKTGLDYHSRLLFSVKRFIITRFPFLLKWIECFRKL